MIRLAIIGAAGRMGRAVVACAQTERGFRVTSAVEAPDSPAVGRDAGVLAGVGPMGLSVTTDLATAAAKADVVVDFSTHANAPRVAQAAVTHRRPLVLGTTGLTPAERRRVAVAARRIPIVMAPNMSLGVNLLGVLVQRAAAVLGPEYDVEIVETHHRFKKDAPSGTALRLGELIAQARGQVLARVATYGRQGTAAERRPGQIGLHAVRAGDVVGEHTVIFAADGERVEFTHRAGSRAAFARGALCAARWVLRRKPGLYDMADVLGLK